MSESQHVKMAHCWKSHALAQIILEAMLSLLCADIEGESAGGLSKYYKDTQTTQRHAKSHKDTQRLTKTRKDTQRRAKTRKFLRVFVRLCVSLSTSNVF